MMWWCLVSCVWILHVTSVEQFLIRAPPNHLVHSSLLRKHTPPVYRHGPLVPFYSPPPPALRAAVPPALTQHTLHVPHTLPVVGQHQLKVHPHLPLSPVQVPPHHHLSVPHFNSPVLPSSAHLVPNLVVTPPHGPHSKLRFANAPLQSFKPSPLPPFSNLHPHHPLDLHKKSPVLGDPRHIHVHHHIHHGGDLHHEELHHADLHHHHISPAVVPVHHHHFHRKPHGVVIKKTVIKKFRDSENDPHRRFRRELPVVLASKLASDPKSKVDLMSTLDNVKDATKNVCESLHSPVYHVRDAIGSTRDVLFSLIKMYPTGLLIPTNYGVMEVKQNPDLVGGINPEIAKYETSLDSKPIEKIANEITPNGLFDADSGDTLSSVQFMLKNGFRKGRDSIQHAGDAVHSVRRAVLTVPNAAFKLLYPFYKSVELNRDKDGFRPTGLLGAQAAVPDSTPRLVGAGRLLELLRAASTDGTEERVSTPLDKVKTTMNERKEKYANFISKLREDAREKIESLNLNY